jgi:nucleotide-binding universal stress UspA family protein
MIKAIWENDEGGGINMKKRFIVLVDFSEYSEHLLQFAYDWSVRTKADLILLHNTPVLLPAMTPSESRKKISSIANVDALNHLKALSQAVLPPGASARYMASEKPLVVVLNELLRQHFSQLVFLGIKETGLLKKVFLGSEAVKVIDGINNVIVAMPQNAPCCSHDSIHVAVQKKYPLNLFEFNKFLKFTKEEIKKITFFSFITADDDPSATEKYLKELAELYSENRDTACDLYHGNDELISLKNLISEKANEFIVLQRGSRLLFDQIFRRFLVNELVYEGHTPLIILP